MTVEHPTQHHLFQPHHQSTDYELSSCNTGSMIPMSFFVEVLLHKTFSSMLFAEAKHKKYILPKKKDLKLAKVTDIHLSETDLEKIHLSFNFLCIHLFILLWFYSGLNFLWLVRQKRGIEMPEGTPKNILKFICLTKMQAWNWELIVETGFTRLLGHPTPKWKNR